MVRVVQVTNGHERRVGLVDEPHVRLLESATSVYALALAACAPLDALVRGEAQGERLVTQPLA